MSPPPRLLLQLAYALAAWTAVAVLAGLRDPLYALSMGRALPPARLMVEPLVNCWVWALLTPTMLWLADRFPLDRRRWRASLAVHAAGALCAVGVSAVLTFHGLAWLGHEAELFIDVYSYAAVVALGHALTYHRLSVAQRLRASELEAQLLGARLTALEARLQPHFLFNALNTVSSLVRTGDSDAAVRAVARLGDLLRALLREDAGQEVSLAQELEFVERYLELERARFGDRLEIALEVDPALLPALVPRLVLQPLVENALRHGIDRSAARARVAVRAARDGAMLRLEVEDWGAGGDAAQAGRAPPSTGVGLSGMRARLARLYGERHELSLVAQPGGSVARVAVPFHLQALQAAGS